MSKRLQVILKDPEYREIQRMAWSRRMSVAEWVRQALALARRREPLIESGKKLASIRVDSNVPMYLIGTPHPHKVDAQRLLEKLVSDRERLVTDAEVLQEILHRYVAIDRRDAIQL